MKKTVLTAIMVSFALGFNVQAGDGHKHDSKKDKKNHSHKEHKCEKCKKSDKECKCEEKHEDHDHSADEKKETK